MTFDGLLSVNRKGNLGKYGTQGTFAHISPVSLSSSLREHPVFPALVSSFTRRENVSEEEKHRQRNFQNGRQYKGFAWEFK